MGGKKILQRKGEGRQTREKERAREVSAMFRSVSTGSKGSGANGSQANEVPPPNPGGCRKTKNYQLKKNRDIVGKIGA